MLKITWTSNVVEEAKRIERSFEEIDGSEESINIERYGTTRHRWGDVTNNKDGSGELIINDFAIKKIADLTCSFMNKLQPVITLLNSMVPWIKNETTKLKEEFTNSILCYFVVEFDFDGDHKFAIVEIDEYENRRMVKAIGNKEVDKNRFAELHRVAEYEDPFDIQFNTFEEAESYANKKFEILMQEKYR